MALDWFKRKGKNITANKKRMWEAEIVNMKHPKEVRSVNPYFDNAKSFFYGKLNSMMVVRAGIGQQHHQTQWSQSRERTTF